jgi:6,7-dimethyl-8-ribityllumazine synthase
MKNKILIVCANYYQMTSNYLKKDAKKVLNKANFKHNCIDVPGVFEIPVVIARNIKKFDGFIALGCVIKGQTPHFDFISRSTFDALINLSIEFKKPIGNGIITALNQSQVNQRSGDPVFFKNNKKNSKKGKGLEAANAVVKVLKNDPKS